MKLSNQNQMASKRDNIKQVFKELVNMQLAPFGKCYEDVAGDPEWYMKYKTTREQEKGFMEAGVELIVNKLNMSRTLAEKEMSWFILQWGLTTAESFESIEQKAKEIFGDNKQS